MNALAPAASQAIAIVKQPRLLDQLRMAARDRGDSTPTAENLVSWGRAFILFHNKHIGWPAKPQAALGRRRVRR